MSDTSSLRKLAGPVGLVAAGLLAGGVLAATLSASADTATPSPTAPSAPGGSGQGVAPQGDGDPHHSQRSDETLLTGDAASKVRAAALAKYPGATIERAETDSDGVYEAHLVTADGQHVTVEVDKSYKVTGLEAHGPGGPGGHHGGRPNDNDADDAADQAAPTSNT
jgi:hypothetical protein